MKRFLSFILAVFVFTSCGDNGSSKPTYLLSSPKEFKVGEEFGYRVEGRAIVQTNVGLETVPVKGDFVVSVTKENVENPYGITCKEMELYGILQYKLDKKKYSKVIRKKNLFYQDEDKKLYECGKFDFEKGDYVFINSPETNGLVRTVKDYMKPGDIYTYKINYEDGSWIDCSVEFVFVEYVKVPAGKFETNKFELVCSGSDGRNTISAVWTNPSTAPFIKQIAVESDDSFFSNLEIELVSF